MNFKGFRAYPCSRGGFACLGAAYKTALAFLEGRAHIEGKRANRVEGLIREIQEDLNKPEQARVKEGGSENRLAAKARRLSDLQWERGALRNTMEDFQKEIFVLRGNILRLEIEFLREQKEKRERKEKGEKPSGGGSSLIP